jgi:hypothetical protein
MFKRAEPKKISINDTLGTIPHCDQKVLHAPGECEFCDKHPAWQALRQLWGIAFTGYVPENGELPDPATNARSFETVDAWGGNKAKPILKHTHFGGTRSDCPACNTQRKESTNS